VQKKFVTNLALVLFLNLLIKPFWIVGIDRSVQNLVGNEQYGFYYSILNLTFILNILLDFGITNFNIKNISQNNHLLNKHISSIILLRLLLAAVYIIVVLSAGIIIRYTPDMLKMLLAIAFNQILLSFIIYLRSNLSGLHLFKTDSIISVLDRLIMIGICGFLLLQYNTPGAFELKMFIYAQTFAYVITTLVALIIVLRKAKFQRLTWRWPFFLLIMKKSYPFAILFLLMASYNRIDAIMLERILPFREGATEAGIYAAAFRLLDAANQIPYLFAGLLLPIFSRMIKLKQNVEEMIRLSFSLLIVPAIIVAICCCFFNYEFMELMYKGEHIRESADVFKIVMWCFVPISTTYIFGTLLTANGNMRQLNFMACTGMLLNVGMNFILIPKYHAVGAAISSISTQLFTAVTQILMVKNAFDLRKNYRLIGTVFLFIVTSFVINYFVYQLNMNWVSRFSIAAGTCFAIAFGFRLISIPNLIRIVKYEE
jgi:O-antigen/teichoic acid export membrane protein